MKYNNEYKRRGIVKIPMREILNQNAITLKSIFSIFYPISIQSDHNNNFYDTINYYGISPLFDELEDGVMPIEYQIVIEKDENNIYKFKEFIKLK